MALQNNTTDSLSIGRGKYINTSDADLYIEIGSFELYLGLIVLLLVFLLIVFFKRRRNLRKRKDELYSKLTIQENKIIEEIKLGKTNKEIADSLFISLNTVKTHINNIYKKLEVKSREDIMS